MILLSTQYVLFASFSDTLGMNVIGFALFGRETQSAIRSYQQPELQWLTSRGGTIFLFGNYGKPQYFINKLYVLAVSLITVAGPVVFFFVQSMYSLRQTRMITMSSKTQAMTQRMFQVFVWQMNGAFLCVIMPVSLLLIFIMFDLRWVVPDAPSTFLRFVCLTVVLIRETILRKVFRRTKSAAVSIIQSSNGYTT
ncbi:hypothetical protein PENTCL1PPCAC_16720, partial [Pristionchus entomophagus]